MAGYLPIEVGVCQGKVVESMLGGTPESVPERYAQSSAITLLPLGIPQVLVWGARDELVPPALAQRYAQEARKAGDHVDLVIDPDAGHFEVASPRAQTWPAVLKAIRELLTGAPRS